MKFKIGDRVKVRKDSKTMPEYAGAIGTINTIFQGDTHPYNVLFDDGRLCQFHANELIKEE